MNTEILGVVAQIVILLLLSYPLGKYIAKVYKGEKTVLDFMKPVERLMYRLSGINPEEEMDWKQFLRALLMVNLFWFVWGMVLLVSQGYLPLNPDGNIGQTCHQAFNTCISFMVNCNLQHYSGESGLTYFTQLFVIMLFQFITAATGMAAMTVKWRLRPLKERPRWFRKDLRQLLFLSNSWERMVVVTSESILRTRLKTRHT